MDDEATDEEGAREDEGVAYGVEYPWESQPGTAQVGRIVARGGGLPAESTWVEVLAIG